MYDRFHDATDEMIEAGIKAMESWESGDSHEWIVRDIWDAMERTREAASVAGMGVPNAQNAKDEN